MVFNGSHRPFEERKFEIPNLSEGEVLVEIDYTTICTSDLHTFFGRRKSPEPSVLGHEIVGRIVDIDDKGVKSFEGDYLNVGDYVTWTVYAHNHNDFLAAKGIPQKSKGLFKYGHQKLDSSTIFSGGYATHCLLRKGTDIFKLPSALSVKVSAPLNCAHATVAGALRLAKDLEDRNLLVVGAGMMGLSACAMGRESGAKNVFVLDKKKERCENALNFGANDAMDFVDKEYLQNKGGVDVIIETSGSSAAIESGIKLLNIGGRMVLVGSVFKQRDLSLSAETVVRNLLTIKGLHNYKPEDLFRAINFLESCHQKFPFESLIGEEFPLSHLKDAFFEAENQVHYRIGVYQ